MSSALIDAEAFAASVRFTAVHGTGTPLGDPIEVGALGAALGSARTEASPLILGSNKASTVKNTMAVPFVLVSPHMFCPTCFSPHDSGTWTGLLADGTCICDFSILAFFAHSGVLWPHRGHGRHHWRPASGERVTTGRRAWHRQPEGDQPLRVGRRGGLGHTAGHKSRAATSDRSCDWHVGGTPPRVCQVESLWIFLCCTIYSPFLKPLVRSYITSLPNPSRKISSLVLHTPQWTTSGIPQ